MSAIGEIEKSILKTMQRASTYIAGIAKDRYAPKGWTLQLSRGIKSLLPVRDGAFIVGRILSQARAQSGYNYAIKQHNDELRHFNEAPMTEGYTEHGDGKTKRARYASGYRLHSDTSPKFATKYLIRAWGHGKNDVIKIIETGIRNA